MDQVSSGYDYYQSAARREKSAKTGLHVLMAAMSSMFFLFMLAYILRSQVSDWEALSEPWQPLAKSGQLWINTGFLTLASICLQWARSAAKEGQHSFVRNALLLSGLSTLGFIIGQLLFWQQLVIMGYYASSNPANAFFFLLTGLHGIHLMGGLVAWIKPATHALMGSYKASLKISIELCCIYWHYLLIVWLILFALFSSSPETYAAIAEFCGF